MTHDRDPADLLEEAAAIFRDRNSVYGANYRRVGEALAALFPDGLELKTADDHARFHIYMLIIVKLSRYAVNWERGHEDSVDDMTVYGAMLKKMDLNAGLYSGRQDDCGEDPLPPIDKE